MTIFKKGGKHSAANYRPVALTAACCKLYEHILVRNIMDHLEENDLLSDNQRGFRRKSFCQPQLLSFMGELAQSMCSGKQVDFSKACDVVPHKRLLNKLDFYGIRGNALKWTEAFLAGRTQQVVADSKMSDIAAKGNCLLGFIKWNVVTSSRSKKKLSYNSLIRLTMEYAAAVWCPYYRNQIHDMEMAQRCVTRHCLHAYRQENVTAIIQKLKWKMLEQRRLKLRVVMGYRIMNDLIKIPND